MIPSPLLALLLCTICADLAHADPVVIKVTPEKASALYQPGEKIVWDVKVTGDTASPITTATYTLKKGGGTDLDHGTLTFKDGTATIETTVNEPCTILAEVTATPPGSKEVKGLGGAAVAPEQLKPSDACPADFDAFWKTKLDQLAAIPPNAVLVKEDSGKPGVDYWKVTLDNINGTHVQGQLARPAGDQKLPALLIVQWAGVYPLQKVWAVSHAAEGWLVLNIMAHDLPIDQPKEFYDQQAQGALKSYTAIGKDDREKSYFLRMFFGDIQAATYLAQRPDWDGKTLVVSGASQGGLQSFVTAGLDPKITAMLVMVPAGCDNTGQLAGRKPGWPNWLKNAEDPAEKQALETSRYFDAVNFAARVKCPVLVGVGLIDVTAPPSGVFTAYNQTQGLKEIVVLPNSDHQGTGKTQVPFYVRENTWFTALRTTGAPPPAKP